MSQTSKLLAHFEMLVRELYTIGDGRDGDTAWQLHLARTKGVAEAAGILELVTADDIQSVIDAVHLDVFGETREARRERLEGTAARVEKGDWEFFEAPAYERYRSKT